MLSRQFGIHNHNENNLMLRPFIILLLSKNICHLEVQNKLITFFLIFSLFILIYPFIKNIYSLLFVQFKKSRNILSFLYRFYPYY